jgi:hypothetical protein
MSACASWLAAHYWDHSTKIGIDPEWTTEPANRLLADAGWLSGTMPAVTQSAELNESGAWWARASAVLALVARVIAMLG